METTSPPCSIRTEWKGLYKAAILENDRGVGSQRAAEAERAVLVRARELFYSQGNLEEQEAIEDALYLARPKNRLGAFQSR